VSRGSLLPEGIALSGEIRGQGDLIVAGSVEGPIQIDGHLVIEATGSVRGEAKARAMVIRGTLLGPAIADETIRLEPGAKMVGDARAERVSVIEGAMLRGRITMTGPQASRRTAAGGFAAPVSSPDDAVRPAERAPRVPASDSRARAPAPIDERGMAERAMAERANDSRAMAEPPIPGVARSPARRAPERTRAASTAERPAEPESTRPSTIPAGSGALPTAGGPGSVPSPSIAAALAPRVPTGVLGASRDEEESSGPSTARFLRPADLAVAVPGEPPAAPRSRGPRKPPEPVIPGVGRQRARRKDGGGPA
jgi:cytoskeletal protein CcmA (bactofilin family)